MCPHFCYLLPFISERLRPPEYCGRHWRRGRSDWNRPRERDMSQHSSLKSGSKIAAKRNVLKRFERVELLKKRGQWKDGDRGLGLRKTKADA